MRIASFRIRNFKGISDCSIDLESTEFKNLIITLIGLNESGKTTVLEALANFVSRDEGLSIAIEPHRANPRLREWVPKHLKANFTGKISLKAEVILDTADKAAAADAIFKEHGLEVNRAKIPTAFTIDKTHSFEGSVPTTSMNYWNLFFDVRSPGQTKYRNIGTATEEDQKIWLTGVGALEDRLPRISYFPTFLFELPEKIYLESAHEGDELSELYNRILQDVLDSQGSGISLKDHVLKRATDYRRGLHRQDAKDQIDAIFRKMSTELNRVVMGAWNEIFNAHGTRKKITIEWGLSTDKTKRFYCQFYILDGDEKYSLYERSLGFRWFFCFLLFTQFGAARTEDRKTYFLFDEPASNLHALAQAQLLASFPKISGAKNVIVYSTHSHYMIHPLWLEHAYIVVNSAIDYDNEDLDDLLGPQHTEITVERYRSFVGRYPARVSYFQPVLDCLDYVAPPIVGSQHCLIVEGKSDFAAMKYFLPQLGCAGVDFLPGTGAGSLDTLISLFIGWGRKFLVLLDDDREGRLQKRRYQDEFLLPADSVATLGDVSAELDGKCLEGLFSPEYRNLIKAQVNLGREPVKKDFATFFQERLASTQLDGLADVDGLTKHHFQLVSEFVQHRLAISSA